LRKRTKIILLAAIAGIVLTISSYAFINRGLSYDKELIGQAPVETDEDNSPSIEDKQVERPENKGSALKNKTIMLDPGHGGVQPGAVNGVHEKVINNSLTKIIAAKLEALGANVIYTRHPDNDIDMSLEDRQEKANRIMPDLLLSIHHDAPRYGFSVHYSTYRPNLEFDGAYFDLYGKRYYVIREEGTVQYYMDKGVLKSFDIKDKGAPYVKDLSPSPAAVASEVIADKIFEEFKRLNDLLDDLGLKVAEPYIRDHNLAMTRRTNMPSVLIEAGPTSKKMNDKSVQNKIADGVIKAIESYFSGK
jgi:N-acetylmuramoyl-L-alanine amidase